MCYDVGINQQKIGGIVMKKLVLSTALLVLGVATLATPAKAAKKATKFSLTPSTTAVTRKRIRTPDTLVRSQVLYPAELFAQRIYYNTLVV